MTVREYAEDDCILSIFSLGYHSHWAKELIITAESGNLRRSALQGNVVRRAEEISAHRKNLPS